MAHASPLKQTSVSAAWTAWAADGSSSAGSQFLQRISAWIEGTSAQLLRARWRPGTQRPTSAELEERLRHHLEVVAQAGLATYPELPATGHAEVDGISVVSVNCMMAMLKLPRLTWHIQTGSVNIGGAVQQAVNALLAGVCKYAVVWRAMHR